MHNTLIVGGTKGIGLAISNLLSQENCIIFSRSDYNPSSSTHHHMKVDVIHDELPELENPEYHILPRQYKFETLVL